MAGSSIFEYVHQEDHAMLGEEMGMKQPSTFRTTLSPCRSSVDASSAEMLSQTELKSLCNKSFSLRMKSTLTKRGMHVKNPGYRVVHILGQMKYQEDFGSTMSDNRLEQSAKGRGVFLGMVALAIALPPPTSTEIRLESDTFVTRMSPDFTVSYCEAIKGDRVDIHAEDLTNRSLYIICHASDVDNLRRCHADVLTLGQAMSPYYRIMTRGGGYVWLQSCMTSLLNGKNCEEKNILAINYILSGLEEREVMMNLWQVSGVDNHLSVNTCSEQLSRTDDVTDDALKGDEISSPKSTDKISQETMMNGTVTSPESIDSTMNGKSNNSYVTDPEDLSYENRHRLSSEANRNSKRNMNPVCRRNRVGNSNNCNTISKNRLCNDERGKKQKRISQKSDIRRNLHSINDSNLSKLNKAWLRNTSSCQPGRKFSNFKGHNEILASSMDSIDMPATLQPTHYVEKTQKNVLWPQEVNNGRFDEDHTSCKSVIPSRMKEVQTIMNRHLPVLDMSYTDLFNNGLNLRGGNKDFGKNDYHSAPSLSSQADTLSPCSLSTICENRESVIRSCCSTNSRRNRISQEKIALPGYMTDLHSYYSVHSESSNLTLNDPYHLHENRSLLVSSPSMTDRGIPARSNSQKIFFHTTSFCENSCGPFVIKQSRVDAMQHGAMLPVRPSIAMHANEHSLLSPLFASSHSKLSSSMHETRVDADALRGRNHYHSGTAPFLPVASMGSTKVEGKSPLMCFPRNGRHMTVCNALYANQSSSKLASFAVSENDVNNHDYLSPYISYADVNHNIATTYDQCSRFCIPR